MVNAYYKKKAAEHYKLWEQAMETGDKEAENKHMREYLIYSGVVK